MRRIHVAAFGLAIGAACVSACDDDPSSPVVDAGSDAPAGQDAPGPDAAVDLPAPPAAASCLDRPDVLPRPPTGQLPCDLIPPGLRL